MNTPPPLPFQNPDESVRTSKTTINPSSQRLAFLHGLHNRRGTVQTLINILLHKLEHELRKSGFTHYDPDRFESAIDGLELTLGTTYVGYTHNPKGQSPNPDAGDSEYDGRPSSTHQEPDGNDRRRTLGVASEAHGTSLQPLNDGVPHASAASGKRVKGRKKSAA